MLTCAEAHRLLSESQDRHLVFMEWFALRFHLMICKSCPTLERHFTALRTWMARWTGVSAERAAAPGPALSPDARERILRAMRATKKKTKTSK